MGTPTTDSINSANVAECTRCHIYSCKTIRLAGNCEKNRKRAIARI